MVSVGIKLTLSSVFLFFTVLSQFKAANIPSDHFNWDKIKESFEAPLHLFNSQNIPFKYLILDLDETLVYSTWHPGRGAEIALRPHLNEFISFIGSHFPVIVYSTGTREYVKFIVNYLDPKRKFIVGEFSREDCLQENGRYFKNIDFIEPFKKHFLIIDDRTNVYWYKNIRGWNRNILKIKRWKGNESDVELLKLKKFLEKWCRSHYGAFAFKHYYNLTSFSYEPRKREDSTLENVLYFMEVKKKIK